jgi:predicted RNase H-like HicB family nuclease
MIRIFKIVAEKHLDGYVAYPLGIHGVVVGQGDTHEEALTDVKSAIVFHLETFGSDALQDEVPLTKRVDHETVATGNRQT